MFLRVILYRILTVVTQWSYNMTGNKDSLVLFVFNGQHRLVTATVIVSSLRKIMNTFSLV